MALLLVGFSPNATLVRAEDGGGYSVIDLGTLNGEAGGFCSPRGLNDRGEVVGTVGQVDQSSRAFLWRDSTMEDLSRPDAPLSTGIAINDHGVVLGSSEQGFGGQVTQDWLWRDGQVRILDTDLFPIAMNDSEVVVGTLPPTLTGPAMAGVWKDGYLTVLPSSGYQTNANAINNRGDIVGDLIARFPDPQPPASVDVSFALLWRPDSVVDLGRLGPPFGNEGAFATAINYRQWVVGQSTAPGMHDHAFIWKDGAMSDLGTLPGFTESRANDVNWFGEVVGSSSVYSVARSRWVSRASLWYGDRSVDLNLLKPASFPGVLQSAQAVNNRGQIIGVWTSDPFPTNSDQNRCFLMTPRPRR